MDRQQAYDKYQERLKFEHDLINRRLTWLLNSQTILFAALTFAFKDKVGETCKANSDFIQIISIMGFLISLMIFIGVRAGAIAKRTLWTDYKHEHDHNSEWGVRTWITRLALVPDHLLPLIYAFVWILIGAGKFLQQN